MKSHQKRDDFGKPESCPTCCEPLWFHSAGNGKRKVEWKTCDPMCSANQADPRETPVVQTATALKSRCSSKGAKRKGTGYENDVRKWWENLGFNAYRTAGSGAHGTRNNEAAFATDVRVKSPDNSFALGVECKRHHKISGLKSLLTLRAESQILWMREDQGKSYVLMDAETFEPFAEALARVSK